MVHISNVEINKIWNPLLPLTIIIIVIIIIIIIYLRRNMPLCRHNWYHRTSHERTAYSCDANIMPTWGNCDEKRTAKMRSLLCSLHRHYLVGRDGIALGNDCSSCDIQLQITSINGSFETLDELPKDDMWNSEFGISNSKGIPHTY